MKYLIGLFFLVSALLSADKKVLVVESYHKEFGWDSRYRKAINDTLKGVADVHFFEMDTKRRPKSEHEERAKRALQVFKKLKPDMVMLGDDNALKYLGRVFQKENVPVVFFGINNNPRKYIELNDSVTGILERPLFKRSLSMIMEMLPESRNILVLFDDGTTSNVIFRDVFYGRESQPVFDVNVDIKLVGEYKKWQDVIYNADRYDAIVIGLYQTLKDEKGENIDGDRVLHWTNQHAKIPLFAYWDFSVGKGKTVGGLVLDGSTHGYEAALVAKKILVEGKAGYVRPRIGSKGAYLFSKEELKRFKLSVPDYLSASVAYTE